MQRSIACALLIGLAVAFTPAGSAQTSSVHERIAAAVGRIRLVDTHEHLPPEADRLKAPPSLFSLLHYVSSDMWADGMDRPASEQILGFGGDYQVPEGAYAHAMLCREVVARVLADKVADGYWTEAEALGFARAILRENAVGVFRLDALK